MDQRSEIGTSRRLEHPIHRACVVPGCWCGSTMAAAARSATVAREPAPDAGTVRRLDTTSADLTGIALRCVGLPVV